MLLSLDLSLSNTGYSVFDDDGRFVETGHVQTDEKQTTPLRLKCIAQKLKQIKRKYKLKTVVIERGFYRHIKSTQQIFRVHGLVNYIFCDIEQIEIHATSVRKLVAGHGNITKKELQEFMLINYPDLKFEDFDEMDSLALGIAYFNAKGVV